MGTEAPRKNSCMKENMDTLAHIRDTYQKVRWIQTGPTTNPIPKDANLRRRMKCEGDMDISTLADNGHTYHKDRWISDWSHH